MGARNRQQYYGLQQQAGGGPYLIDPDLTLYVKSVGQIIPHSRRSTLPYGLSFSMILVPMLGHYLAARLPSIEVYY